MWTDSKSEEQRQVTLWRVNPGGATRSQMTTLSIPADSFPVAIVWRGVVYVTSAANKVNYHNVATLVVPDYRDCSPSTAPDATKSTISRRTVIA